MKTMARRRGGKTEEEEEKKEVGRIEGEHKRATGGRAPRKEGGGVFSAAHSGTKPSGRHTMSND